MKNKLRIYYYFLREARKKFLIFLFFSIGLSITYTFLIATLYPLISFSLNQAGTQKNKGFILAYISKVISAIPIGDPIISASIVLIILAILLAFFRYSSTVSSLDLAFNINYNLQKKLYDKTLNSDINYFIDNKQGDIVFKVKDPPLRVAYIIRDSAILIRESLLTFLLVLIMLSINIKLTLLVFALGAIFGAVIRYNSKRIIYKSGKEMAKTLSEEDIILAESLGGIYTIKAHLAEKKWVNLFVKKVSEYIYHAKRAVLMKEVPILAIESFVIILIALSAIIFERLYSGSFKGFLPAFSIYVLSILRIIPSLTTMSNAGMNIVVAFVNMEICYEALHKPTLMIQNGRKILQRFENSINFKNISFAYPGSDRLIFKNLSFALKNNKITAIVGKTGSGKTTLLNLLLRFYDPTEGIIEIDGTNLKEIDRPSWLSKIGYANQEPFIFHSSIRENITFTADYNQEEVEGAARLAGAHQFIINLKDGYQTVVGEKGMKLSGGEKQRIAIARALLRKPEILIFDEATSALDIMTENLIQEAIQRISSYCAVIIIAHRLSTVKIAHKILVFDNGELIEEGSHEDLLKAKNHYSKLYAEA